jgi:hypothetical protein
MYREEFQPELSSDDLGFRIVAVRLPVATARSSPVVGQQRRCADGASASQPSCWG